MSEVLLKLIGVAWVLAALGFLLFVGISLLASKLLPHEESDDDADEFEGDAWDRALDQARDERWEVAS